MVFILHADAMDMAAPILSEASVPTRPPDAAAPHRRRLPGARGVGCSGPSPSIASFPTGPVDGASRCGERRPPHMRGERVPRRSFEAPGRHRRRGWDDENGSPIRDGRPPARDLKSHGHPITRRRGSSVHARPIRTVLPAPAPERRIPHRQLRGPSARSIRPAAKRPSADDDARAGDPTFERRPEWG